MKDYNLKVELERIVNDLGKVDGVEGSLIIDGNGDILSQRILLDIDIGLFGPMAHVITSSSKRLLNSSNQGEIQRILVESEYGKALFFHLGNVQFIVLMKNRANVGLIMVSSKRAAEKIVELTKDLEMLEMEEQVVTIDESQVQAEIKEKPSEIISEEVVSEKPELEEVSEPVPDEAPEPELEVKEPESKVEAQADSPTISEVGEESVEAGRKI